MSNGPATIKVFFTLKMKDGFYSNFQRYHLSWIVSTVLKYWVQATIYKKNTHIVFTLLLFSFWHNRGVEVIKLLKGCQHCHSYTAGEPINDFWCLSLPVLLSCMFKPLMSAHLGLLQCYMSSESTFELAAMTLRLLEVTFFLCVWSS